jgi:hypothetical protein
MRYTKRFFTVSKKTVNNYIKQYRVIPEKTINFGYYDYFIGSVFLLNFGIFYKIRENTREYNLKNEIRDELYTKYKLNR